MIKLRFLIFALCAFLPVIGLHEYERRALRSDCIKGHTTTQDVQIPAALGSLRPNYPYSVIPRGVYSPAELQAAIQKDPVVREHYADFNARAAQLVKLTDDRYQYVSFRFGNRIFWTYKELFIPRGEVLLADGNNYARARCANRLSDVPKGNTTPLQPADRLLSLPPLSLELLPQPTVVESSTTREAAVLPFETPPAASLLAAAFAPPLRTAANWPELQQEPPPMPPGPLISQPFSHLFRNQEPFLCSQSGCSSRVCCCIECRSENLRKIDPITLRTEPAGASHCRIHWRRLHQCLYIYGIQRRFTFVITLKIHTAAVRREYGRNQRRMTGSMLA
jgi:hypothetical protein